MGRRHNQRGYSAEVRIALLSGDRRFDVAEICGDRLVVRGDDLPSSGHAELLIEIDGDREVRDVILSAHADRPAEFSFG